MLREGNLLVVRAPALAALNAPQMAPIHVDRLCKLAKRFAPLLPIESHAVFKLHAVASLSTKQDYPLVAKLSTTFHRMFSPKAMIL